MFLFLHVPLPLVFRFFPFAFTVVLPFKYSFFHTCSTLFLGGVHIPPLLTAAKEEEDNDDVEEDGWGGMTEIIRYTSCQRE